MVIQKLPVIISIPHGGTWVPDSLKNRCRLSEQALLKDGDTWARYLYDFSTTTMGTVAARIARAVVDMNRDPGDRPPSNPDGVEKTVTVFKEQVWDDPEGLKGPQVEQLIEYYHNPYHDDIARLCRRQGVRLGLDCHTMLDRDPESGEKRPMICISNNGGVNHGRQENDTITSPPGLMIEFKKKLEGLFSGENWQGSPSVDINHPFKGGYIIRHHGSHSSIPWIQLEINRKIYLPGDDFLPGRPDSRTLARMQDIRNKICRALEAIL